VLAARRSKGKVQVEVIDNGLGIPPDMVARVFEMFTQVPSSLERSQGGLGLGLALVTKLAQMHGGEVWAHSDGPGLGSTFTLQLPLAAEVPAPAPIPIRAPTAVATGLRVLVVDDNVDAADSLAMLLQLAGHDTVVTHTGAGAIELARSGSPEVVFLDIGLPQMNGYEVARALRGNPALAQTKLIALTGWAGEDARKMSRDSGFDFHLSKPADSQKLEELLARIQDARQELALRPPAG
jgi:CheY-like chemotaxis protein